VKKKEIIRLILMPIAFIAVVLFALLMPTGTRYASSDDILSVEIAPKGGQAETLDTREGVQSFVDWLGMTVPAEEMCFVRETDAYQLDGADWTMVANQVPDKMVGLDNPEIFAYSIYHMYAYVEGKALYYNGVEYDMTPEAVRAIAAIGG
jgi:hypothetical protein